MPKKSLSLKNFSKGLNTESSPRDIEDENLARSVGVTIERPGILRPLGKANSLAGNSQYYRFLDDTNHIVLTFANEDDDEVAVKLDKGRSLILAGDAAGGMADMLDMKDSALSLSLGDLKSITADADTASCDMEIFVAEIA